MYERKDHRVVRGRAVDGGGRMKPIKHKRPKWRKATTANRRGVAPPSTIECGGNYRVGDRLTMTNENGSRLVEVVEVYDGRVAVREVTT
jgi:hypothetical protein